MALGKEVKGITVEIGGSTTGLGKALEGMQFEANKVQKELRDINKLLDFDGGNIELQYQKMGKLSEAVEIARKKLEGLRAAQQDVEQLLSDDKINQNQYNEFTRAVIEAEQELKKAETAQKGFTDEIEKLKKPADESAEKIEELGDEAEKSADKADKSKSKWENFKGMLGGVAKAIGAALIGIGTGIAAGGKKAFDVGVEFESAFAGVKKTIEGTDEEIAVLRKGIREMALEVPASTTEIATIAENAGQLGIAAEDILDFTKIMIDMGEATNLSSETAATALAKMANITEMPAKNFSNLGSAIVALGNESASTESEIVEMATRLMSTGEVVGLTEAQMLAVATSLSDVGIEAEAGGSAISKLMKKMEVAVGTYDNARAIIDKSGKSLRELELLSANNSKAFKDLADDMGLTSTELNKYIKQTKSLEQFSDVAGITAEEFIQAWGNDAVGAMGAFIGGLDNLEGTGKSAVQILDEMGLTEVRLSNAILSLSTAGNILTENVELANKSWEENTALTKEAEQRYETMESKIGMLKNTVSDFGLTLYESLREPMSGVLDFAVEQFGFLNEAFKTDGLDGLLDALGTVIDSVVGKISENAEPFLNAALDILFQLIDAIIENLPKLAEAAAGIILTLVEKIIEYLPKLTEAAVQIIVMLSTEIGNALPKLMPMAVDAVITIVNGLIDNVDLLIDGAIALILGLADGLIEAIPKLLEAIPKIIAALVKGLIESYPKLFEAGWILIGKLGEGLLKGVFGLIKTTMDIGAEIGKTLKKIDWGKLGKELLDGIINGMKNAVSSVWNGIKDIGSKIVDGFTEFFGINSPSRLMADRVGKHMASGIGVGFVGEMENVSQKMIKAMPQNLLDFGAEVNPVFTHSYESKTEDILNITMPIMLDGKPIAKKTSKIQHKLKLGRSRAMGIAGM